MATLRNSLDRKELKPAHRVPWLKAAALAGLFLANACSQEAFTSAQGSLRDSGAGGNGAAAGRSDAAGKTGGARNGTGGSRGSGGAPGSSGGGGGAGAQAGASGAPSSPDSSLASGGTTSIEAGIGPDATAETGGSISNPRDAATAGGGESSTCTSPTTWYPDSDRDSYGRSTGTVVACDQPSNGFWALEGGDCQDDDADVHPKQQNYFDGSYSTSGGTDSFDYDCSGHEDGDPSQIGAAPNCGSLLGIGCAGSGFRATNRTGVGVNPLCGSRTKITCTPAPLACNAVATSVSVGYRCR